MENCVSRNLTPELAFLTYRPVWNEEVFEELVGTRPDENDAMGEIAVPCSDPTVPVIETLPFVVGNGTDEIAPDVEIGEPEMPVLVLFETAVPGLVWLGDVGLSDEMVPAVAIVEGPAVAVLTLPVPMALPRYADELVKTNEGENSPGVTVRLRPLEGGLVTKLLWFTLGCWVVDSMGCPVVSEGFRLCSEPVNVLPLVGIALPNPKVFSDAVVRDVSDRVTEAAAEVPILEVEDGAPAPAELNNLELEFVTGNGGVEGAVGRTLPEDGFPDSGGAVTDNVPLTVASAIVEEPGGLPGRDAPGVETEAVVSTEEGLYEPLEPKGTLPGGTLVRVDEFPRG